MSFWAKRRIPLWFFREGGQTEILRFAQNDRGPYCWFAIPDSRLAWEPRRPGAEIMHRIDHTIFRWDKWDGWDGWDKLFYDDALDTNPHAKTPRRKEIHRFWTTPLSPCGRGAGGEGLSPALGFKCIIPNYFLDTTSECSSHCGRGRHHRPRGINEHHRNWWFDRHPRLN